MSETEKTILHYGRLHLVHEVMGEPLMPYANIYEWLQSERDIRIKNLPDDMSWQDFMTECVMELHETLKEYKQNASRPDLFEAMGLGSMPEFPEVQHG